ncbi:hypothetical protein [Dyadobacter tibetensis]|uniref:hypothetical protein n=1 Tax=Dyadobacter tibetensis TaxID=1211851 RepID=UPI000472AE86|nr:hypothetical protein [Dyadobacter tibetensis]
MMQGRNTTKKTGKSIPRAAAQEGAGLDGSSEEDPMLVLDRELERLDKQSKLGKWTVKTLILIRENPHLKSADLAVKAKKEQEWLKLSIRKLKSLGLTLSHEPGYSLSPLGEQYLAHLKL